MAERPLDLRVWSACELVKSPQRITKSEERFLLFLKKAPVPLHESDIVAWYVKYVERPGNMRWAGMATVDGIYKGIYRAPNKDEVRRAALAWFDSSLGRAIRKNIIPKETAKRITGERVEIAYHEVA